MTTVRFTSAFTIVFSILLVFSACAEEKAQAPDNEALPDLAQAPNPEVIALMDEFKIKGVGLGFIENGVLVNTEYYGEQSPGIPINDSTMFNVASSTKAITAEVFLRLAAKGEVSLDEPISGYYVYADIADDPRHKLLTPRIILTHRTGFRNWPYMYDDEKLAFDNDPGRSPKTDSSSSATEEMRPLCSPEWLNCWMRNRGTLLFIATSLRSFILNKMV